MKARGANRAALIYFSLAFRYTTDNHVTVVATLFTASPVCKE